MTKNEKALKGALGRAMPKRKEDGQGDSIVSAAVRPPKLSVSLYQRDLDRLDEIKAFMQQRGARNVSDSEALRLAVRGIELGDGLLNVYQEMLGEDGRRRVR